MALLAFGEMWSTSAARKSVAGEGAVAVLERANDEDVRIVPALAQGGVGEAEAHLLAAAGALVVVRCGKGKQGLLVAEDQVLGIDGVGLVFLVFEW